MTRIPIKEEKEIYDIINSWSSLDPIFTTYFVIQILQDHEIVNRLNERIEELEQRIPSFSHGIKANSKIHNELRKVYEHALEELKKIRDGK